MTDDRHPMRSGSFTATTNAHGAEMCSLKHKDGTEFLRQAGPARPRMRRSCFRSSGAAPVTNCATGAKRTG
ncbi:hypothetical protein [Bradyrhizobium sp. CCBAU 11434]|uniref:hypothetical protein n=1 Tax=Bradyrhizobium sp. CCBAU 11434 TaxID=1630885 RepID=UPI00230578E6|nr:hypothetical protein [Bradyrhizobium sp. CCBAU 11434]